MLTTLVDAISPPQKNILIVSPHTQLRLHTGVQQREYIVAKMLSEVVQRSLLQLLTMAHMIAMLESLVGRLVGLMPKRLGVVCIGSVDAILQQRTIAKQASII